MARHTTSAANAGVLQIVRLLNRCAFFATRVRLLAGKNVVMGVETAGRIVRKFKICAQIGRKKGHGRPRATTARVDSALVRHTQ